MQVDILARKERQTELYKKRRAMFGLQPLKPKKAKLVALNPSQSEIKVGPIKPSTNLLESEYRGNNSKQIEANKLKISKLDLSEQISQVSKVKKQAGTQSKNREIEIKKVPKVFEKPRQKELGEKIVLLTEKIGELKKTIEKVTNFETRKIIKAEIKSACDERALCIKSLKRCKSLVVSSKKSRERVKMKLLAAGKLDKSLLPRSKPGRPRLTEAQEGLLQAIER